MLLAGASIRVFAIPRSTVLGLHAAGRGAGTKVSDG